MNTEIFDKKVTAFFVMLFFFVCFNKHELTAQTPDWIWAKSGSGIDGEFAYAVSTDPDGNVFVAGYFESDSITIGGTTLYSVGDIDAFIVKYDADGNVIWAKGIGSTGPDHAVAVTTDASGNCYVGGYFNAPSITIGSTTFTNAGNNDLFVVKYDANGNVLWAKSAGGAYDDYLFAIAAAQDGSGDIYMTGIFYDATITFGSITLTNTYTGFRDIYLAKYDADGNEIWVKSAGGSWDDNSYAVAPDASGNIYITGNFNSPTITITTINGPATLTNMDVNGTFKDMFIIKYNSSGSVLWAKSMGGSNDDYAYSVAADNSDNSYVTGMFLSPTITFGLTTLNNTGDWNMYLVKSDPDGNALWAKNAGDSQNVAQAVVTDGLGNLYAGGYFNGLYTSFDTITLTNSNNNTSSDIFLVKYDGDGNALWAKGADGDGNDQIFAVTANANGVVYAVGNYSIPSPIVFDTTTLECVGFYDMFVAKIGDSTSLLPVAEFNSSTSTLCEKFCIDFSDQSLNNPVSWQWTFEGASPDASTDQNPTNICYDDPGVFDVTLIITNADGISDTLIMNDYITVYSNPFAPAITQAGNTLTSSNATTYQWYLDGNIIPGATDQSYDIIQSGLYTVEITNENGCSAQASIEAIMLGIAQSGNDLFITINANPTDNQLVIESNESSPIELEIVNPMGQKLIHQAENFGGTINTLTIDVSDLPSGIYFLVLHSGAKSKTVKWVKQ